MDWKPTATIDTLKARAELFERIRIFFKHRHVLEVDTPILGNSTITDVYLEAIKTPHQFLQTSPEFAMKRLLAANSGSIYQICKAFREDESGRLHNSEFLMLEWYRLDFDMHMLMRELAEMLGELLDEVCEPELAEYISYQQLFINELGFDPLVVTIKELRQRVQNDANGPILTDKDELLQCLFVTLIEPRLAFNNPLFVHSFPASQAALAKVSTEDCRVAERFELYYKGVELANGFNELQDADEQLARFEKDNKNRKELGKQQKPIDFRFIAALKEGLPQCSGVAMGLDRLLMLMLNRNNISEVMSFNSERA